MAGLGGRWKAISEAFGSSEDASEIKQRLNAIVVRRNQIVHEGDYRRLERPRNKGKNSMSYSEASDSIDFLERLIRAIHSID